MSCSYLLISQRCQMNFNTLWLLLCTIAGKVHCTSEIQFRERALASLLAPESPPPACLHVGGAYQRFLFFFVPLDQAPHHVLITLLHFLHFYSSLPSLFVSHGEWRYCFSIFNSFSLFLFTINLKKLLSRKNYKYSLDNFVSYKKNF